MNVTCLSRCSLFRPHAKRTEAWPVRVRRRVRHRVTPRDITCDAACDASSHAAVLTRGAASPNQAVLEPHDRAHGYSCLKGPSERRM